LEAVVEIDGVFRTKAFDTFTSVLHRLARERKSTEKSSECFDGFKSRCGHVQGEIRGGVLCFYDSRPTFYLFRKLPDGRPYVHSHYSKNKINSYLWNLPLNLITWIETFLWNSFSN